MDVKVRCTLRDRRIMKGITVRQLEAMSGVNRGLISRYECNKTIMSIERAAYFAILLDCKLDDIYEYEPVVGDV